MRALLLLLTLAGCAAAGPIEDSADTAALTRELSDRVAGEPRDCVSQNQAQSLRVVDRRTIVYHAGDTVWVNRLRAECPGLRPHSTLIVETSGSGYCRNDRIRGVEPGAVIAGPNCLLGDFVPWRRRD
jgi:hypothetical protein